MNRSAFQNWVLELTVMQQSVLASGVRGPDGLRKDHPVKSFMRWYRRCILISAFDGRTLDNPLEPGGGSFTGPLPEPPHESSFQVSGAIVSMTRLQDEALIRAKESVFRAIDELPHHFWLHLVHCAQILGYKHPNLDTRAYWFDFYNRACGDMHLYMESEQMMDLRLSDSEIEWRARETTAAR